MALTDGIEGGNAHISRNTSRSEEHMQELTTLTQDEKHFPFLRLPAEIRNDIYRDVLDSDIDRWDYPRLLSQPAITKVNRQTRAEALALWYLSSVLELRSSPSAEWVPFVQKVLEAFDGGPGGLPGGSQSTLRFLGTLSVIFRTYKVPEVFIEIQFDHNPHMVMEIDPEDDCEAVAVGSPDMDWTDAAAAQAACDEAAEKLADDITERTTPDEDSEDFEFVAASTHADRRAALDGLRLFALACPHLCKSVYICDNSHVDLLESTDGYPTDDGDESLDEHEYAYAHRYTD